MADIKKSTDGPTPHSPAAYDLTQLPDWDNDFVDDEGITQFERALHAPEPSPSSDNLLEQQPPKKSHFITALNDWRPVHQRIRKRKKRTPRRGKDETREGISYSLLKWPLLAVVFGWLFGLGVSYLLTRLYIWLYEHWITWRGKREKLRRNLSKTETYEDWVAAAKELDKHLGNDEWKKKDSYAYYNSKTIKRIRDQLSKLRAQAEQEERSLNGDSESGDRAVHQLRGLLEACVKNNFVGFENPHLYSESYYGTKDLLQSYIDEVAQSITLLQDTDALNLEEKRTLFKHLHANFGRTALCLSGGATFAYYHFGVAKALLDANLLPQVITGTSGGALVAALLCTRTDDELKKLLVPALAHRITACSDDMVTWVKRWYKTGARFDSVDWARRGMWFTRGSLTFREAYQRTGRILNVSCVPSDPHSPTILANYITAPDCVIWSAVLASAAVPGILNPVVLMKKKKDGTLEPYSFGHKWKDGSLRTDVPLKALNLHFNVRFSIVSQVNPHVNLFFFSSRGTVGRPVTHRRGRGWRGGFVGSAFEQYLKLDLTKWLKVLRHLELLPRPLGQDWSEVWLQRFSGTITIWPKSVPADFYYILSDPTPPRLARMIHVGQQSTFPKLKFIANRMTIERAIEEGRKATRPQRTKEGGLANILSEEDLKGLLKEAQENNGVISRTPKAFSPGGSSSSSSDQSSPASQFRFRQPGGLDGTLSPRSNPDAPQEIAESGRASPSLSKRISGWWSRLGNNPPSPRTASLQRNAHLRGEPYTGERAGSMFELRPPREYVEDELYQHPQGNGSSSHRPHDAGLSDRRQSVAREIFRQSRVFIDDSDTEGEPDTDGEAPFIYDNGNFAARGGAQFQHGYEQGRGAAAEDDDEASVTQGDEWDEQEEVQEERAHEDEAVQRFLGNESDESGASGASDVAVGNGKRRGTFVG
ncbi:acyl transferase/acyl hydrolase/lysophospholipase [Phyllosticta capitalensis]